MTVSTANPQAGITFNIRFTLDSPPPGGSRVAFILDKEYTATCSAGTSICIWSGSVGIAGAYNNLNPRIVSGSSYTPITVSPDTITIGSSSGSSAGQCCVIREGETFIYGSQGPQTCSAMGGSYYSYPCSSPSVQGRYCTQFCSTKGLASGQCTTGFADGQTRFDNVCASSGVCQCGAANQQQQLLNLNCNDACMRKSGPYGSYGSSYYSAYSVPNYNTQSMSLPVGICTDNPTSLIISSQVATGSGVSAAQGMQRPFPVDANQVKGAHGCGPAEECWCMSYNFNAMSATPGTTRLPSSIPGTGQTPRWTSPDAMEDPPQKQPNERNCAIAVNATITASFGSVQLQGQGTAAQLSAQKLTQSGEPVTIVGTVTKMTDECAGYTYTCLTQQEINCKVDNKPLRTTLEYQSCPANLPEKLYEQGEGSVINWKRIAASAEIAGCIWAMAGTGGAAAPALAGPCASAAQQLASSGCDQSQIDAMVAMGLQQALLSVRRTTTTQNPPTLTITPTTGGDQLPCSEDTHCPIGMICTNTQCVPGVRNPSTPETTASQCTQLGKTCVTGTASKCMNNDIISNACPSGQVCCNIGPLPTAAATANPTFDVTGQATGVGYQLSDGTTIAGTGAGLNRGGSFSAYQLAAFAPVLVSMFPNCPSPERVLECFTVCGKTYTTKPSYAPTCAGAVVGYEDSSYKCGLGECGGFAGKRVNIKILGPQGETAIDDSVTAGTDGTFSYTFNAPVGDGEFAAVISVAKD